MAEEISFDNGWWETRKCLTSNENSGDKMMGCGSDDKLTGDDKRLDPNICNENQMKQLEVGLNAGDKEINDGENVVHKENGKGFPVRKRKQIDLGKRVVDEKRRRDNEAKLYQELLALLPHLTTKVDKAKILQEAENCIKSMDETLRGLEKQKQERLRYTDSPNLLTNKGGSINSDNITDQSSISYKAFASSNVALNVCGVDAVISIYTPRDPTLFTSICYIFEKHNMEVVHTEISSDHAMTTYLIRVRANVPLELAKGFPYEGMYKEAVAQIKRAVTLVN